LDISLLACQLVSRGLCVNEDDVGFEATLRNASSVIARAAMSVSFCFTTPTKLILPKSEATNRCGNKYDLIAVLDSVL